MILYTRGEMLVPGLPSFVKSPEDQTGISGGVASFVCQATGEPKPRITWMKKGKKVSSQRFEVIEFDDAIYECTATNSAGEINTSAKLTVLEGLRPPVVLKVLVTFVFQNHRLFNKQRPPSIHTSRAPTPMNLNNTL
ncbi:hypothetical protein WMY93_000972 [Mugilogobius chulae]|uniref:Ig-like domain-containing protein n=1 Tax=Mugilogobius chulae TaxID=88201 RepID=A0AAW0QFQ9_9GOBI